MATPVTSPRQRISSLLLIGALLLITLATILSGSAFALEIPASPEGRVSDYARALSAENKQTIEAKLAAIEGETGNQFAIAIFESLEEEALEDFSIRLADKWKIGQAGTDNGLILLVFLKEHKIRIEVGYGLEGSVPDVLAGRVIREVIAPKFRTGDIAGGLYAAVISLDKAARGDVAGALPKKTTRSSRSRNRGGIGFIAIFIIVGILNMIGRARYGASMVSSRKGRGASIPWWMWLLMLSGGSHRGGGGGFGGGGGGFGGGGGGFGGGGASGGW